MTKIAPIIAELFPEILSELSNSIKQSKVESDWTRGRPSEKSIFTSDNREHVFKALLPD